MSGLNNLRKKETFLTLGEDELLAKRVGRVIKPYKEKDVVENARKKLLKN